MSDQPDLQEEAGESVVKTINPTILDKLNQFEAHTRRKETCMACGYVGIMGIGDEIRPWWLSWWFIAVIAIVGSIFMGAGLVIGGGLIALRAISTAWCWCARTVMRSSWTTDMGYPPVGA